MRGIAFWKMFVVMKVSRLGDASFGRTTGPRNGSESTGRGRCPRCFRSPGHSNFQQLPAP